MGIIDKRNDEELQELRRWKAEAIEVLSVWDEVYARLGSPGRLGESKAVAALAEVERSKSIKSSQFRLYIEDVLCKYKFETCAVKTEQVILELQRLGFVEKDD